MLTLVQVSIFYLPLGFVSSVFGMTNMPISKGFSAFGWTVLGICIPTYVLVGTLYSINKFDFLRKQVGLIWAFLIHFISRKGDVSKGGTGLRPETAYCECASLLFPVRKGDANGVQPLKASAQFELGSGGD